MSQRREDDREKGETRSGTGWYDSTKARSTLQRVSLSIGKPTFRWRTLPNGLPNHLIFSVAVNASSESILQFMGFPVPEKFRPTLSRPSGALMSAEATLESSPRRRGRAKRGWYRTAGSLSAAKHGTSIPVSPCERDSYIVFFVFFFFGHASPRYRARAFFLYGMFCLPFFRRADRMVNDNWYIVGEARSMPLSCRFVYSSFPG